MSLEFGFGYENNPGRWPELFKKLTKLEKDLFHNCLPFTLLGARVGHITEETIPHIIARETVNEALQGGPPSRAFLTYLTYCQLVVEHGDEAAAKYRKAVEAAEASVNAALPGGFKPDPVKALRRYIGYHTNVRTVSSHEFLAGLSDRRFCDVPKLTPAKASKICTAASKLNYAISTGKIKHPALDPVEGPATTA